MSFIFRPVERTGKKEMSVESRVPFDFTPLVGIQDATGKTETRIAETRHQGYVYDEQ